MPSPSQEEQSTLEQKVFLLADSLTRNSQTLSGIASIVNLNYNLLGARLDRLERCVDAVPKTPPVTSCSALQLVDIGITERLVGVEQRVFTLEEAAIAKDAEQRLPATEEEHLTQRSSLNMSQLASEFYQLKQSFLHVQAEVMAFQEKLQEQRWEVAHNSDQISALKENLKQHQHHQVHQKGTIEEEALEVNKLGGNAQVQEGSSALAPSVTMPNADARAIKKELTFGSNSVHEFVEGEDELRFQESIWDGAFFIGMHGINFDAFFAFWLLVINIAFQGLFTWITWKYLSPSNLDDDMIDGLRNWRIRYGHRLAYYSRGKPLVARVCGGDKSLEMSYEKQGLLDAIEDFVPEEGLAVGPTVCAIGMYCWILAVLCELQRVEKLLTKLLCLPKASVTQIILTSEGVSYLTRVSWGRHVFIMGTIVFRVVISVGLLFGGLKWLAHTTDLGDLLMNAVALEFVFSLDERIYQAMATAGMRMYIASGIKIPRLPQLAHLRSVRSQLYPLMMVVTSISVGAFAMLYWLTPQVQTLHDAHDLLCSGNVDFVFSRLNAPGSFFGWSQSSENTDAKQSVRADQIWNHDGDFFDKSVVSLITTDDPTKDSLLRKSLYPAVRWTEGSLGSIYWKSFQEQNYYSNPLCEDMQENTWDQDWDAVLSFVEIVPLERTCVNSQWTLACDDPTKFGQTARMFCPVTCGCATPDSNQVLEGCPAQCMISASYQAMLSEKPCENSPVNVLLSENSKWKLMLQNLKQAADAYTEKAAKALARVSDVLSEYGCPGLERLESQGINMCSDFNTMPARAKHRIRYWCPEHCNCRGYFKAGCPKPCLLFN